MISNLFNRLFPVFVGLLLGHLSLQAVDFAHEVMPILKRHCAECHAGTKKKGGLSMNTRTELLVGGENGQVVEPGNATRSLFMVLIRSPDDDERMPPKGPRLATAEIATLEKWINANLPWEPGATLGTSAWEPPLKPRVVDLPPPSTSDRDHPIDRLLDADLVQRKQAIPSPASDARFLRRASMDVIGLLPTPEALQAFVSDSAPDKRQKLIDRLLADDVGYADHWLTTWNDLLRNDYTGTGFITGGRKQITTWLYEALRQNKPYDEFVRELISPTDASAGFINGIKWRGEVNSSQTREIQFAQNISQVFLGINMKCASCHDSFIDRWTLGEAYNLAAIYADKPLELNRCDKPVGKMATPKWIFPELGDVNPEAPRTERLKQLARLMTHPDNGRFTRTVVNRLWDRLMGRGIVHPVDAMHTEPWNEDLLDYLALRFAKDGYNLRKFIRFVMTSKAYQSRTAILPEAPGEDHVYTGPLAKRMTAEQLLDSIWQITGTNPSKAEANVDRSVRKSPGERKPTATGGIEPAKINAQWIWPAGAVSPKAEFRKSFSLKSKPVSAIMRATCDNAFTMKVNGVAVASSRDWQKPLRFDIAPQLQAGENRIEVEAEMFGGAAGFIGQLEWSENGKSHLLASDAGWQARKPGGDWAAAVVKGNHGGGPWGAVLEGNMLPPQSISPGPPVRAALVKNDFLMRSLGRPHRDQVVTTRPAELTTLQAIDLSNGDILADTLAQGARQLMAQNKPGGELIEWLHLYAFSREPTTGERAVLGEIIDDPGNPVAIEDLLWLIFMQPEFQMIR